MKPRTNPPPEVERFIAELREFARPTLLRRARGLAVRIVRKLRRLLRQKHEAKFGHAVSDGMVLELNGKLVTVESVSGNVITLTDTSTLTQ